MTDHFSAVAPGYHHVPKRITPAEPLVLPTTYLKWYRLCRPDQVIDPAVEAEARAFLTAETEAARLPIAGDLGFAIHHLSGEHTHLLLVFTWRENNEMWETVYVRGATGFDLIPQTTHRAVMCVWEFGAVAHEHEAWTRYLRSPRDAPAKQAYVTTQFSGTI
ncbi:hypothetical protein [Paractinoplanes durhamensis]|uniref:Uncharacterized protein n=1 Tax=Paractinoplanes durhamensis TaxID=113563 RepID=A0ABQ3Z4W7_9ACTN|nr:hypothetical protein [Actinoplanes durhamensis]GIE04888.1 hypothetical protein Adu01nite_62380 [Actinoplanes durhamensis]